jgi:NAD(P)-dependent dehydrogenase (short-subunit alcohol dehydrogenase family)
MKSFHGKVAVVTGAASGIGRSLALALAAEGARLAISDVDTTGLAETAALARARGAQVHEQRLDVADRDAVVAYAETVAEHYGVVHLVVNNAGIALTGDVLDLSFKDVPYRVLRLLSQLLTRHGESGADGWRIKMPLTVRDLSSMVGSNTETVGRLLDRYESEGLVRRQGSSWLIPDQGALTRALEYASAES